MIGEEWKRQLNSGALNRELLFLRLYDCSRAQFRRDLCAIEKIGIVRVAEDIHFEILPREPR